MKYLSKIQLMLVGAVMMFSLTSVSVYAHNLPITPPIKDNDHRPITPPVRHGNKHEDKKEYKYEEKREKHENKLVKYFPNKYFNFSFKKHR